MWIPDRLAIMARRKAWSELISNRTLTLEWFLSLLFRPYIMLKLDLQTTTFLWSYSLLIWKTSTIKIWTVLISSLLWSTYGQIFWPLEKDDALHFPSCGETLDPQIPPGPHKHHLIINKLSFSLFLARTIEHPFISNQWTL